MGRADRAEAVAVARALEAALAGTAGRGDARWLAAALLHDAGKQCSGYGTLGRAVVATVVAAGRGQARVRAWAGAGAPAARPDRALRRPRRSRRRAPARGRAPGPRSSAWAGAHHRPDRWGATGIPPAVCRALAAADGEPDGGPIRGDPE